MILLVIPLCGEMTDNSQLPSAEDGLKHMEENPEQYDHEVNEGEPVSTERHDGEINTTLGASVSDLTADL